MRRINLRIIFNFDFKMFVSKFGALGEDFMKILQTINFKKCSVGARGGGNYFKSRCCRDRGFNARFLF